MTEYPPITSPEITVDAIRYRAPHWREIWPEPGMQGVCNDLDALLVHYDALVARTCNQCLQHIRVKEDPFLIMWDEDEEDVE